MRFFKFDVYPTVPGDDCCVSKAGTRVTRFDRKTDGASDIVIKAVCSVYSQVG